MLKLKKIPIKKPENKSSMVEMSDYDYQLSYHPNFSVNGKQIPEIKDWKVGEKYTIVIEVEMKRMSAYDNGTKKTTDASFDVTAYAVIDQDEDMSDEDLEALQGKALAG